MRFLLFGTGDYYNRYKKWFAQHEVLALLDNSVEKQYTEIDGLRVLPPKEGIGLSYESIVILSFYVESMKKQLMSLGVEKDRIYHFYDLHELFLKAREIWPVHYFLNAREIIEDKNVEKPKILLLSNELTLGGPPIALFHAALILKRKGYRVVFASMWDGPLRERITESGIPVVVDENLQVAVMKETEWVNTFSLIVCNTLNFHVFLSERDTKIPVLWWLHDARFFYDGVNRKVINRISLDNLKAVSVGPVPAKAIGEFLPDMECEELLYGVGDTRYGYEGDIENKCAGNKLIGNKNVENSGMEYGNTEYNKNRKIRLITIGFLEDIKGQDVLVEAVKRLPDAVRTQCEFTIVGHDKTLFGEKIHKESEEFPEIIFTGSVSRKKIHSLLEASDVLICPSRQDSMPTVAAEAMMHFVPCIVSDTVGTASYIHDGRDGFLFQSGNAQKLAEKIEWCVFNRDKLKGVGKHARKLYESYFSMTVFEDKLLEIIQKML